MSADLTLDGHDEAFGEAAAPADAPGDGERSAAAADEVIRAVGARLRARREQLALSLRDVAAATGLSVSMVSLAERGMTVPSIGTLVAICDVLRLPMAELFASDDRPRNPVVRRQDQSVHASSGGMTRRIVTYDHDAGVEVSDHEYERGGSSSAVLTHHGGREVGLVIEGQLTIELGEERYVLGPGDCIRFPSTVPHRFVNSGRGRARAVWWNLGTGNEVRPGDLLGRGRAAGREEGGR